MSGPVGLTAPDNNQTALPYLEAGMLVLLPGLTSMHPLT